MLIPCGKMPTPRGVMGMAHGEMLSPAKPNEMAATARKQRLRSVICVHQHTPRSVHCCQPEGIRASTANVDPCVSVSAHHPVGDQSTAQAFHAMLCKNRVLTLVALPCLYHAQTCVIRPLPACLLA